MNLKVCQRLSTTNDVNGNPRRLWVVHEISGPFSTLVAVYQEDYDGRPLATERMTELAGFDITPAEYREIRSYARKRGNYHH